ncbi:MAG: hypothetical protein JWL61_1216 [Gemmatimonadetes bacterium]|nr:hypothetical protein [Gemmatimonadota bacterium]
MTKYIRGISTPLALSLALMLSACTVSEKKADTTLASDPSLTKDLQLAGRDTAAQPALKDVPTTPVAAVPAPAPTTTRTPPMTTSRPKPVATKPKPAAPTPPTTTTTASGNTETRNPTGSASSSAGGAVGTIASGTSLSLRSNERVCTNTHHVGSTFTATLANSVTGSNGATIPAGATVSLEVTQLKRSENATDKIVMEFAVKGLSYGGRSYPVSATVADAQVDRVRNQPQSKDVQKVVGGAVIGAIAGQILGKSTKSTIIGAAAGAAGGAGVAAGTANYEGCVPDGGNIVVTLNGPLQVKVAN